MWWYVLGKGWQFQVKLPKLGGGTPAQVGALAWNFNISENQVLNFCRNLLGEGLIGLFPFAGQISRSHLQTSFRMSWVELDA